MRMMVAIYYLKDSFVLLDLAFKVLVRVAGHI
jgi:hypothetical protein